MLEAAMESDRLSISALLIFLPLAAWAWIVVMARDMYGPMTGASAWMMTPTWDLGHLLLLWAMWAVMMTGMMLPSAAPTVLLYGAMIRRSAPLAGSWSIYALGAGYVVAWAAFSIAATALQRILAAFVLMTPMMEPSIPWLGAALLVFAGIYQMTPVKQACLRTCQSPFAFLMRRWRAGTRGAFRMGLAHGIYCVGCCWALMLLLFAGGVMNLIVIAALTVFVAFEKLAPFGPGAARVSGVLLIGAGLWMFVR
jgi:predicted metal-binding membrane protein